jgi:hypothetical protein
MISFKTNSRTVGILLINNTGTHGCACVPFERHHVQAATTTTAKLMRRTEGANYLFSARMTRADEQLALGITILEALDSDDEESAAAHAAALSVSISKSKKKTIQFMLAEADCSGQVSYLRWVQSISANSAE